ncbi:stage III sporulation protein AD [Pseudogracilibacillus auburnensis]|uniref:Stage III sporulation protein AD n=1 Tax=Pseudogracilibacillus auburnensis TaxID=1494959 RepID=A0A2V3VVL6_9BACI|nr:stage III sporulation protein AD [Pseudogracilibacillus auburnensis]MBO1004292.1 stage III sporulation protein AD [Pseudogracilibacillus auburnensis]PXW85044.1 stage III sporulation protein AD [Pseudogracilibacillus auburnensis]
MDIIQIVLIGIIASLLYIILKDVQPTFAFVIILITSVLILMLVVKQIGIIIQLLTSLADKATINSFYLETILKIIGIAYITELGANVTKDAGLASVASKVELAGKIFILLLAIPIISAVVEVIINFIPTSGNHFL